METMFAKSNLGDCIASSSNGNLIMFLLVTGLPLEIMPLETIVYTLPPAPTINCILRNH